MRRRSRLNKHLEKQSRKTLFFSIVGIVLILFLLVKFGIPFIADLGFISSQIIPPNNKSSVSKESVFLSPPSLDLLPSATNSADLKLFGLSTTGKDVSIYINGSSYKRVPILSDGGFSLDISLTEGANIIKAKAIDGNKESDFSDPVTINFKKNTPNLSIGSPSDNQTTKDSPFNISGKTDPAVKVTVNDFWAIVDSSGNFSYSLSLKNGGNDIKVVATDEAGNKTEKTVKLNYSP